MATKVLVVDDEPQILTALSRGLQRVGHEVIVARNGEDGLAAAAAARPDLVLLDLKLPDLDGIEVVRRLRTWTTVPIVLLSGQGSERARVAALDAGADDFVDKPFSMEELRARVGAMLRRAATAESPDVAPAANDGGTIQRDAVTIELAARRVLVDGREVRLTPTEWRLLTTLASNPDRIQTYRQVITSVWDESYGEEARQSLRVHLRTLRAKLGDDASAPRFVATEPGVGYRWIGE
ncbi:response regulator transcription factor [Nitriliruptor alkaliphilus]|uniref:response regulator transcription factor n=1 Tax=Nitriliruptor alkaliphilus TaxID=427918 RepID=UPI000696EE8E|nr:response regulator transcription factor [Nitriliruptor alkaliphilus]